MVGSNLINRLHENVSCVLFSQVMSGNCSPSFHSFVVFDLEEVSLGVNFEEQVVFFSGSRIYRF